MSAPHRTSTSVIAALSEVKIPAANHEFIERMTRAVGIVGYRVVEQPGKPYVIATRRDGQRELHIYYGATNGFDSEDEVVRIAGDAVGRGKSASRKGTWYVLHPVNQARPAGKRSQGDRPEAAICDCGMQRSLTGVCDSCD
ncbi:MAG TPA: hypothetical protein VFK56_20710 [Mycobacterium sp.]|nr:hypothetical protein [Mycobacterium sp.]